MYTGSRNFVLYGIYFILFCNLKKKLSVKRRIKQGFEKEGKKKQVTGIYYFYINRANERQQQ